MSEEEGRKNMPNLHLAQGSHIEEAYPEVLPVWKTKQYLAGVIDSEGSFAIVIRSAKGLYYPLHTFTVKLLATREWIEMANYWTAIYGGRTYMVERKLVEGRHRKDYRWVIYETETLLRFLNELIPYLSIKRMDAEKLRKSLIAYKAIIDKGRPTREFWEEWIRRYGLRRWLWGAP